MNQKSKIQNQKSSRFSPSTSHPGFIWIPKSLASLTSRRRTAAFTLIELLVVIAIIGLLAGIGVPTVSTALRSAKKSEVAAVAQSIRTSILAWNSEYGTWPTNVAGFTTDSSFLELMTTTNSPSNPRGIIFLEIPAKFTNSSGIVTPPGYLTGSNSPFYVAVDVDGDGVVTATNGTTATNLRTSVAVWAPDSSDPNKKSVGTWK